MRFTNVSYKEHNGIDIRIYEMESGRYTVDVKKPCGEFIWGWEFMNSFNCAMMKAVAFIDQMQARGFAA